ncbi:MAG TPA: peptidyl-prolyl cis-trans isomerase [Candidatus Polarisedimenticolia bacterium]|nr:peptidyl-prolyl cis-trans isomerase [Candidatus Polarisedimenticolia bacterium]
MAAVLLAALFPLPSVAAVVEEIVAKINNRIITKSEFEERGQVMLQQVYQKFFGEDLDREIQAAQESLLANLITESLLMERAQTIFDFDQIRASLVSDFREQQNIASDEELDRLLIEQEMTRAELEDQLLRLAVPGEIINYDVRRKISVSETEIKDYYDSHMEEWTTPEQVSFREVVLFYDARSRYDVEGRMDTILRELGEGADFVEIVRRYSEAGTREADGLIGPLGRTDLNPAIAAAAFGVGIGEVADPIDTGRSLHLIKIVERSSNSVKNLESVREQIQDAIRQSKFGPRYQAYLKKLWKENQVEVMPKYKTYLVVSPLDPVPGA